MSDPLPIGELALKTVAMPADTNPADTNPADTNPAGDIFGGWIVASMDLSAGTAAPERAKGRTATASVSHLNFLRPVKVGDVVCVCAKVIRVGRRSISLAVDAWAVQRGRADRPNATAAEFVMVALDENGKPRAVDPPEY
jgi:acyl-CoA thioesterase YciA